MTVSPAPRRLRPRGSIPAETLTLVVAVGLAGAAGLGALGLAHGRAIGGEARGTAQAGVAAGGANVAVSSLAADAEDPRVLPGGREPLDVHDEEPLEDSTDPAGRPPLGDRTPPFVEEGDAEEMPAAPNPADDPSANDSFSVQIIAYGAGKRDAAEAYAESLRDKFGFDAYVEESANGLWVVKVGHLGSDEEAEMVLDEVRREGLPADGYVVVEPNPRADDLERPDGLSVEDPELVNPPTFDKDRGAGAEKASGKGRGVKAVFLGLWNGAIGVAKEAAGLVTGGLELVRRFAFDFLLDDVVKPLGCLPLKALSGGSVCGDTPWVPLWAAGESVVNFVRAVPGAVADSARHIWREGGRCVLPGNGLAAEARGQSCGRVLFYAAGAVGGAAGLKLGAGLAPKQLFAAWKTRGADAGAGVAGKRVGAVVDDGAGVVTAGATFEASQAAATMAGEARAVIDAALKGNAPARFTRPELEAMLAEVGALEAAAARATTAAEATAAYQSLTTLYGRLLD